MGHFEKIVVLIATTCVTVILVVTFTGDGEKTLHLSMGDETFPVTSENESTPSVQAPKTDEGGGHGGDLALRDGQDRNQNPRSRSGDRGGPAFTPVEQPDPSTDFPDLEETVRIGSTQEAPKGLLERSKITKEQENRANRGDLFLDDSFSAKNKAATTGLPAGSALITVAELRATFDDDLMEYTLQKNDTMTSVAKKLYGSTSMAALLRQFNEDRKHVPAGETILVPIFDDRDEIDRAAVSNSADLPRSELSEASGTLYTVADGDSLWEISKKVYGKGSQWQKILDANSDVLKSAELIQTGMELRIP